MKWWRFVRNAKQRYLELRDTFLASRKATELTPSLKVEWTKTLQDTDRYYPARSRVTGQPPEARHFKEKIINWMAFWPFSILGTIFYDFLREFWDMLYDAISGVYDSIAKAIFSDVSGDLLTQEQIDDMAKEKVE